MDRIEYRTLQAGLRPPTFVVAYRPMHEWIYTARTVVASVSRLWGGAGGAMVPVDAAGEVPAPLLDLLRVYDPDLVAGHVPVLAEVADADATMIEKIVKGHAYAGEAPADTWQRMSTEWVRGEGWASLANQLDAWCSPFKDVDPDSGSFTAGAVHWLDRYQDSDRDITIMPSSSEEQILTRPPGTGLDARNGAVQGPGQPADDAGAGRSGRRQPSLRA